MWPNASPLEDAKGTVIVEPVVRQVTHQRRAKGLPLGRVAAAAAAGQHVGVCWWRGACGVVGRAPGRGLAGREGGAGVSRFGQRRVSGGRCIQD